MLTADRRRRQPSVTTAQVPRQAHLEWWGEDDGARRSLVATRDGNQPATGPALYVRRVDHGEAAPSKPQRQGGVEELEGGVGRALVVRIVGNHGAHRVG